MFATSFQLVLAISVISFLYGTYSKSPGTLMGAIWSTYVVVPKTESPFAGLLHINLICSGFDSPDC